MPRDDVPLTTLPDWLTQAQNVPLASSMTHWPQAPNPALDEINRRLQLTGQNLYNTWLGPAERLGRAATSGILDVTNPETAGEAFQLAGTVAGARMPFARAGELGSAGGKLPPPESPSITAYHGSPDYPALLKSHGPEFQNATVIDHQGNIVHNPLSRESVGGPMLRINEDGSVTRGILAYHGSPYDFDRFDISKIGTGEGAQAYGSGLYFAESEGTAKSYRDRLSGLQNIKPDAEAQTKYKDKWDDLVQQRRAALGPDMRGNTMAIDAKMDAIHDLMVKDTLKRQPESGRMYQVSIQADPEHFLDWDKPLSEQSEHVKAVLAKIGATENPEADQIRQAINRVEKQTGPSQQQRLENLRRDLVNSEKEHIQRLTRSSDQESSDRLRAAGIPGIKYFDQGSRMPTSPFTVWAPRVGESEQQFIVRGPGDVTHGKFNTREEANAFADKENGKLNPQTRNFVVFDDKLIDILKKYGLAGLAAIPGIQQLIQSRQVPLTSLPQQQ